MYFGSMSTEGIYQPPPCGTASIPRYGQMDEWMDAHRYLLSLTSIHPFSIPLIWPGYSLDRSPVLYSKSRIDFIILKIARDLQ